MNSMTTAVAGQDLPRVSRVRMVEAAQVTLLEQAIINICHVGHQQLETYNEIPDMAADPYIDLKR